MNDTTEKVVQGSKIVIALMVLFVLFDIYRILQKILEVLN